MRVTVVTIFPDLVRHYLDGSILGRGARAGLLEFSVVDLRAYSTGAHRSVDDAPYGGGPGMLLLPEPLLRALSEPGIGHPVLGLTPTGVRFDQAMAEELSRSEGFTLVCGRYEGFDARVEEIGFDGTVSIGDFVLAGGELAALAIIEAVARLVPGVLGNAGSLAQESFADRSLLEYPSYTRPPVVAGSEVPEVLLSGNHRAISDWRRVQSLVRTIDRRPDLIERRGGLRDGEVEELLAHGYAGLVELLRKEHRSHEADRHAGRRLPEG